MKFKISYVYIAAGVVITLAVFIFTCYKVFSYDPIVTPLPPVTGAVSGTIGKKENEEVKGEIKIPVKGSVKTVYTNSKGKRIKEEVREVQGVTKVVVEDTTVQTETSFESEILVPMAEVKEEKRNEIGITYDTDLEITPYYKYYFSEYAWIGVEYEVKSKEFKAGVGLVFKF